jgi:hypothetical protein
MEDAKMDNARLESEFVSHICLLAVSARGLIDEPKFYGPMRLLEAAQRLVELAENFGIHNELLAEVSNRIEEAPLDDLPEGEKEFVQFMDDLVALLVDRIKQS